MDTKSFHLGGQPAPEGLLTGVSAEGEFHGTTQPASEALLAGVAATGEIHLKEQYASEGLLKGVAPKGEFHGKRISYHLNCQLISLPFTIQQIDPHVKVLQKNDCFPNNRLLVQAGGAFALFSMVND